MKVGRVRDPSSESRRRIDAAADATVPVDATLERWHARYRRNHRDRLASDLEMTLAAAADGAAVLEVGAAPYLLTQALSTVGVRTTALDIDPERYADTIARLDLDVRAGDVEAEPLPFPDDSFDIVLFNEVLEHLRIDPVGALREVRRVLRPNGRLFLSTPNLLSLRGVARFLLRGQAMAVGDTVYEEFAKLDELGHMGHVREYTFVETRTLLARVGLSPQRAHFRGAMSRSERILGAVLPPSLPFVTFECS